MASSLEDYFPIGLAKEIEKVTIIKPMLYSRWANIMMLRSTGQVILGSVAKGKSVINCRSSIVQDRLTIHPGLTNIISIAAGKEHMVVLTQEGKIMISGYQHNDFQLVPDLDNIVEISCSGAGTMALEAGGLLWMINHTDKEDKLEFKGDAIFGIYSNWSSKFLSYGRSFEYTILNRALAIWRSFTLVADTGLVYSASKDDSKFFKEEPGLKDVIKISAGYDIVLFLKKDGTVFYTTEKEYPIYKDLPVKDIVDIAAGTICLFLTKEGTVLGAKMELPPDGFLTDMFINWIVKSEMPVPLNIRLC